MNCPKCGAEGTLLRSHSVGLYYDFDCGSSTVCEGEEFEQSAPCRELCDLRKWREVVLGNLPYLIMEHCVFSGDSPVSFPDPEAFDSAVRKEMECES